MIRSLNSPGRSNRKPNIFHEQCGRNRHRTLDDLEGSTSGEQAIFGYLIGASEKQNIIVLFLKQLCPHPLLKAMLPLLSRDHSIDPKISSINNTRHLYRLEKLQGERGPTYNNSPMKNI